MLRMSDIENAEIKLGELGSFKLLNWTEVEFENKEIHGFALY